MPEKKAGATPIAILRTEQRTQSMLASRRDSGHQQQRRIILRSAIHRG